MKKRQLRWVENTHAGGYKAELAGFLISLAGTIPLGVLNLTAIHLSATEGLFSGLTFSVGVVLVEMAFVYVAMWGMARLKSKHIKGLQWVSTFFLLLLAAGIFYQYFQKAATLLPVVSVLPPLCLGMLLSATNPLQIPFWLGWNTWLLSQGWMKTDKRAIIRFSLATGAGTLLVMAALVVAAGQARQFIASNQPAFLLCAACLVLAMAVWQVVSSLSGQHQNPHD